MLKFKVLEYNEKVMSWLGIRLFQPADKSLSFLFYSIFLLLVTCTISCIIFIYINWPKMETIYSTIIVSIVTYQTSGMFLSFGLNTKKVSTVHLQLQDIVDEQGDYSYSFCWFVRFVCFHVSRIFVNNI